MAKHVKALVLLGVVIVVVIAAVITIVLLSVNSTGATTAASNQPTSTNSPASTNQPASDKRPYNVTKLSNEEKSRINCFLEEESRFESLTQYQCEEVRGCIYRPSEYQKVPSCFYDREKLGYTLMSQTVTTPTTVTYELKINTDAKPPFLKGIENLRLDLEYINDFVVNVKILDADNLRYEVPYPLNRPTNPPTPDQKSRFETYTDRLNLFHFKIIRNSDNKTIFDTGMGAFVYTDQFLQLSTYLESENIYGFGENNHESLKHNLDFTSWGMFARDNAPGWGDNRNNYGFQPVYLAMENSGKSHLVLLYNSNAMEYLFTPTPSLTFRTIGGILDFYFIVDETPESVLKHYHNLIGLPMLPPYWALGFHISRWGYKNLQEVRDVVDRNRRIGILQDVQHIDIDYMNGYRILTVDQNNFGRLGQFTKNLENSLGIKTILIVDPGLVIERNNSIYMTARQKDLYVKWPYGMQPYDKDALNTNDIISWCWPNGKISYPDYMNEDTHDWWYESLRDFTNNSTNGSDMAGIWIDMNEPSSFETNEIKPWNWLYPDDDQDRYPYYTLKCPPNIYDDPPYRTKNAFVYDGDDLLNKKAKLSQKTICMVSEHKLNNQIYKHYDVHNLYGHSQAIATHKAFLRLKPDKRVFSLTRSNFVGTGKYAFHWLGDNDATWKHMRMSIIGMIEYNIFGIPMVDADICGFFISVQDAEMCTRWLQLGAFSTFSRNHNANENIDKDPAAFNNKTLEESTRNVLRIRYSILPYVYTELYKSHRYGGSVIKALFFEFPLEKETLGIDQQFLLGPSFLVSPVLYPGHTSVNAYFPNDKWYDFRTGVEQTKIGWVNLNASIDYINLHLRGGSILVTQSPLGCFNTVCSRNNPLAITVSPDRNNRATGNFFWDDGVSLVDETTPNYFFAEFTFANNQLNMTVITNATQAINSLTIQHIRIASLNGYIQKDVSLQLNDFSENIS